VWRRRGTSIGRRRMQLATSATIAEPDIELTPIGASSITPIAPFSSDNTPTLGNAGLQRRSGRDEEATNNAADYRGDDDGHEGTPPNWNRFVPFMLCLGKKFFQASITAEPAKEDFDGAVFQKLKDEYWKARYAWTRYFRPHWLWDLEELRPAKVSSSLWLISFTQFSLKFAKHGQVHSLGLSMKQKSIRLGGYISSKTLTTLTLLRQSSVILCHRGNGHSHPNIGPVFVTGFILNTVHWPAEL